MPEVHEYFPQFEQMDTSQLHLRREELLRDPSNFENGKVGDYDNLKDMVLAELFAITRALRKKAAAPGSSGGKRTTKKAVTSIESLA